MQHSRRHREYKYICGKNERGKEKVLQASQDSEFHGIVSDQAKQGRTFLDAVANS
jgi:hypothetical protein